MHKFGLIGAAIGLSLLFVACGNQAETLDTFLVTQAVAITCEMDEMAESKEYLAIMSGGGEFSEVAERMAVQDYKMPEAVYELELSDDIWLKAVTVSAEGTNLSEGVKAKIRHKINGSVFGSMINGFHGAEMVVASSLTSGTRSYLQPDGWKENKVLLLEYDGEFSSIVSFQQSGEGVISANSIFVKNGDEGLLETLQYILETPELPYTQITTERLTEILKNN